ncbi:MAG: hypothetical protein JXR83_13015 [Deltaproteobacteria bacterium]|nr:hypothetical protein [Deltaproteobacteria bacterium]
MAPPDGIHGGGPTIRPPTAEPRREADRAGQPSVGPGARKAGRAKKKGKADGKSGIGVGGSLGVGVGSVDAYEDDGEEQRKRRRANWALGDDEPVIMNPSDGRVGDRLSAIAPEFRPQMIARMAAANSMSSGTTLVPRGDGGDGNGEDPDDDLQR